MKRIKYIVSYDVQSNHMENRVNVLASSNKIDYIVSVLNGLDYQVELISTSQTLNKKFYPGKKIKIGQNVLRLFPTTWRGGLLLKCVNTAIMRLSIWNYLRKNVSPGEKVIIYHSSGNMWILNYLKKYKKAYVIEEVEEIYGEIFQNRNLAEKEKKKLQIADAYIYPTMLLDDIVNKCKKPSLVVHGAYVNTDYNRKTQAGNVLDTDDSAVFEDERYHIGYTGILDPQKGCLSIVKAAKYLDEKYHIHILGFGSQNDIDVLNNCIFEISEHTKCKITFDGVRRGAAYEEYLKKLDIGICLVDSQKDFILTQFPSKVISYMVNGLPVLCSDIDTVKTSDVADAVIFYDGDEAEDIAEAITIARTQMKHMDANKIIKKCHEKFIKEIEVLLEGGR